MRKSPFSLASAALMGALAGITASASAAFGAVNKVTAEKAFARPKGGWGGLAKGSGSMGKFAHRSSNKYAPKVSALDLERIRLHNKTIPEPYRFAISKTEARKQRAQSRKAHNVRMTAEGKHNLCVRT